VRRNIEVLLFLALPYIPGGERNEKEVDEVRRDPRDQQLIHHVLHGTNNLLPLLLTAITIF
jgi:hypothetical protein